MDQQKIMKISSIVIGIIIAVLLTIMGFKVLSGSFTRASDMEPRDVVVSTILENSAKLSWSTGIETQGVVEYGTTPTALNFFSPEPQKIKSHIADLTLLTPNTSYYFQIRIGDKKYDNGGVPWTFTTKSTEKTLPSNPTPTTKKEQTEVKPTAVQRLEIPVTPASACDETDCVKIKDKLGKGCTTQDYMRCLKKSSTTPTTTITP